MLFWWSWSFVFWSLLQNSLPIKFGSLGWPPPTTTSCCVPSLGFTMFPWRSMVPLQFQLLSLQMQKRKQTKLYVWPQWWKRLRQLMLITKSCVSSLWNHISGWMDLAHHIAYWFLYWPTQFWKQSCTSSCTGKQTRSGWSVSSHRLWSWHLLKGLQRPKHWGNCLHWWPLVPFLHAMMMCHGQSWCKDKVYAWISSILNL